VGSKKRGTLAFIVTSIGETMGAVRRKERGKNLEKSEGSSLKSQWENPTQRGNTILPPASNMLQAFCCPQGTGERSKVAGIRCARTRGGVVL